MFNEDVMKIVIGFKKVSRGECLEQSKKLYDEVMKYYFCLTPGEIADDELLNIPIVREEIKRRLAEGRPPYQPGRLERIVIFIFSKVWRHRLKDEGTGKIREVIRVKGWRTAIILEPSGIGRSTATFCFKVFGITFD